MGKEDLATNFDLAHCHKWAQTIHLSSAHPSYRAYWKTMVDKMNSLSSLLLKDELVKNYCSPSEDELSKINQLFIDDTVKLIAGHRMSDDASDCLSLRIAENREIIKVALVMRNIVQRFGKDRLREIVKDAQDEFVSEFNQMLLKNKKLQRGAMDADHEITRAKQGTTLIGRMHNCPAYGIFVFLGLLGECKEFCVLCEAHGKTLKFPFAASMSLTKCFSRGDGRCEFSLNIKAPLVAFFLKILPNRFFK